MMFKRYTLFLLCLILVGSVGGAFATWRYSQGMMDGEQNLPIGINGFIYLPEEMPDEEVTLIERLAAILNQKYQTDIVVA